MLCTHCGIEIPAARLEALPETKTCVEHSSVQPYKAIISGTTKNKQFDVQVVKADDPSLDYHEENRWGKVSEADD